MDAVLTTLIGAAPQLGASGVLVLLLGLLVRREAQDRADHRTEITELTTRHAAELTRIAGAHDAQLVDLRREIAGLRQQLDEVNRKLDDERDRRRRAEDARPPEDPALGRLQGGPPWQ